MASSTFFKLATGAAFTLPGYPAKEDGTAVNFTKLDATRAKDEFGRIWSFSPALAIGAQGVEGQSGNVPSGGSSGGSGAGTTGATGKTGATGSTGATGATGAAGASAGFLYNFSADNSATDPGNGFLKFNAAPASATAFYISKTDNTGKTIGSILAELGAITTGLINIVNATTPGNFAAFSVSGALTDNTTWDNIPVTFLAQTGTFNTGDGLLLFFSPTANGLPAGGTAGQFLVKIDSTNYNTQWVTKGTVPPGGTANQVLTKIDGTDYNTQWSTPSNGADVLQVQVFS